MGCVPSGDRSAKESEIRESHGNAPTAQPSPSSSVAASPPSARQADSPTMQPKMVVNVPSSEDLWASWWPPIFFTFNEHHSMVFQGFVQPPAELHPAPRVRPGDLIIAISEQSLLGVEPSQVLQMLAGPEGTLVSLDFDSGGDAHTVGLARSVLGRPVVGPAAVRGLDNPGNCCFLNAPTQCIAHTFPTMVAFSGSAQAPANDSKQLEELYQISYHFAELAAAITVETNKRQSVSTTAFRRALAAQVEEVVFPGKAKQEQEDAHQLLLRLLDVVDSALLMREVPPPLLDTKRKAAEAEANMKLRRAPMNEVPAYEPAVKVLCELAWERDMLGRSSIVQRMMWGQYVKGIGCFNCHKWVEVRPEVYNMLELPIPNNYPAHQVVKLSKCLELFFDQENSKNDHANQLKCPGCNKAGEVSQKYALMRIPAHLVLVLKRYTFTSVRGSYRISKAHALIEPPEVIDMREHIFNSGDNANPGGERGGTQYELGSICVHLGDTPRAGHYVALVKNKGKWFRVSDESVTECQQRDWDEARRNCYILFYKQR